MRKEGKKERRKEGKKERSWFVSGLTSFAILAIAAISFGQASSPNGCLGGNVINASTSNTITDGTVTLFGLCEGSGCDPSVFGTTAEIGTDGRWSTDAYSSSAPEDVVPFPGVETVALIFDAPGYHQTIVFHTPVYATSPYGERYSQVPTVPLAPSTDVDVDGDGLYSTQEAYFGTSDVLGDADNDGITDSVDTDGDGLSDLAEVFGENFIDLAGMGADPLIPDVFVEIDCMVGNCPTQAILDSAEAVFDDAPYPVQLHAIVDDQLTTADDANGYIDSESEFESLKAAHFSSRRMPYFRYAIWSKASILFSGENFDAGFYVSMDVGNFTASVGTFVHELGHQFGFGHGGSDDDSCKPNYFSVMNYLYQQDGLIRNGEAEVIDYSRFKAGDLDETDLYEPNGIPLGSATFSELSQYSVRISTVGGYFCTGKVIVSESATGPVDWNNDGDSIDLNLGFELMADRIADQELEIIKSHDDWLHLDFTTNDIGSGLPMQLSRSHQQVESSRSYVRRILSNQNDGTTSARIETLELWQGFDIDASVRSRVDAFRANSPSYQPTPRHTCQ